VEGGGEASRAYDDDAVGCLGEVEGRAAGGRERGLARKDPGVGWREAAGCFGPV